jgi:hypothetical protein
MKCNLLHYFKSDPIRVITSFRLREIIGNQLTTGRITKWALELMGLDIAYVPQTAIKSQTLTEFVTEWTETQQLPPPPPFGHPRALELVFRWLLHPQQCRGRRSVDLS